MINVLFLCIGNSCRSQMAEGFARVYGSDVMRPYSAGLSPAPIVQPLTKKVMLEKNINLDDHYPKDLAQLETQDFQLIVNMSGNPLPIRSSTELRVWRVPDPMGQTEEAYVKVRDQLEGLVMQLILELRRRARTATATYTIPKKLATVDSKPMTRIGFGRMRIPRD